MRSILLALLFIFGTSTAFAVDYTFIGSNGADWSAPASWKITSSGVTPAGPPGAGDIARINTTNAGPGRHRQHDGRQRIHYQWSGADSQLPRYTDLHDAVVA